MIAADALALVERIGAHAHVERVVQSAPRLNDGQRALLAAMRSCPTNNGALDEGSP